MDVVKEAPSSVVQPARSCTPLARVSVFCQNSSAVVCGSLVGKKYLLLWKDHRGPTSAHKHSLNFLCNFFISLGSDTVYYG